MEYTKRHLNESTARGYNHEPHPAAGVERHRQLLPERDRRLHRERC
jgi:hypothetical protein